VVIECAIGCATCEATVGGSTSCTLTKDGFSLIAGVIINCHPNCKSCLGTTSSDCETCYEGTTFEGGRCTGCTDPNALECLSSNVGFSTLCIPGFTPTFYNSGGVVVDGGTCNACSDFCLKCDSTGPTNCDLGECK
jgi:hypothetical protein